MQESNSTINPTTLLLLKEGLKDFGLNPKQWRLEFLSPQLVRLIKKGKDSVELMGSLRDSGRWNKLWLSPI